MTKKQEIIDIVIEQIKEDMLSGDCTVLDELLQRIPLDTLIQSLPEETWKFYEFENNYFEIKSTGFNEDSQREEIQINCGENGVLYLFKTDEGFIVDVYNQDDNVSTLAVFETDLEPDIEELSTEDKVYRECELIYDNAGYSTVFEYVNQQKKANNPDYKDVIEAHCTQCGDETPMLNNVCLVCGTIKR